MVCDIATIGLVRLTNFGRTVVFGVRHTICADHDELISGNVMRVVGSQGV